jgi:predicted DNA-binding transcriptional regulator AlpA
MTANTEFISIPEWCRRVGCSLDSGYRAARRDEIPGLFCIGRLKRVNWMAFLAATEPGVPGPRAEVLAGTGPATSRG